MLSVAKLYRAFSRYGQGGLRIALVAILVLAPFHGLISVVAAAHLPQYHMIIAAWKDMLLAAAAAIGLGLVIYNRKFLFDLDAMNVTALVLIMLGLVVTLANGNAHGAFWYGVKVDIGILAVYLLAQLKIRYIRARYLLLAIIVPATIVAVLGLLQEYFIPVKVMTALGYNSGTINPVQLVDATLNVIRVFSTLGGPNQMGAYLVVPICLAVASLVRDRKFWLAAVLPILCSALYLSYSRSAWIGLVVGVGVTLLASVSKRARMMMLIGLFIITVVAVVGIFAVIKSDKATPFKNVLLHGHVNSAGALESSDTTRPNSARDGIKLILKQPFGYGLGSAGPASYHTESPVITENWYLQIAIELGVLGLILMLGFLGMNAGSLLGTRTGQNAALCIGLGGALVGLMCTNLFLHTFADSTLGLVLFGAMGLARKKS